jgi:uncharacterized protein
MAFGGIPFYLNALKKRKSIDQNIDDLYFDEDGLLYNEYENLYASLFKKYDKYIAVIQTLSSKNKGLTRAEISKLVKIESGGFLTEILSNLELSDFIRIYFPFGKESKSKLYQLTDAYSLFYHNFLTTKKKTSSYWINDINTATIKSWSGYAFEMVCLMHVEQIKKALGVLGTSTDVSCWRSQSSDTGAQIDLILDRKDGVVNIFEIKYTEAPYSITKKYYMDLMSKKETFQIETKTKKTLYLSTITTYGLKENEQSDMIQYNLKLEDLFS